MKLLGFAYLAVLLGANSATAKRRQPFGKNHGDIQVNYYSDSHCSDYSLQVNITWGTEIYSQGSEAATMEQIQQNSCYIYSYGGSVNIVTCFGYDSCECWFYKNTNCGGQNPKSHDGEIQTGMGSHWNCLANSSDYYSFMCAYSGLSVRLE